MVEIVSKKNNLSKFFYYWVNLYDNKQFPNFEAVYQFVFTEENQTYYFYLSISKGKAEYSEGKHKSPSVTIYSPASVWFDISSGRLNQIWGWLTKKYRIEGPLHYLKMLNMVFKKRFTDEEILGAEEKVQDFEISKKRIWRKPNKTLIINGSPRKKDGLTYFYLQYLIKGIKQVDVETEVIDIYNDNFNFEFCKGCFICWTKTNGECIVKDTTIELIEKINTAYLTIFAFPLYIDSIPGKLKAFLDRLFVMVMPVFVPYYNLTRHPLWNLKERYIALFSINGFPEIKHFKPVVETFKGIARNSHRPLIVSILRPGAGVFTIPPYTNYLEEILRALECAGRELVEGGKISRKILKSISGDYGISKELWRTHANLHWSLKRKTEEDE